MSVSLNLVKTLFSLEEVSGDNYNDMKVMLSCVTTQAELRDLWQSFNDKKYFRNLTETEKELITIEKDKLKDKLKF